MWKGLSSEKSRTPATAIKVTKSRHNSRTKLRMKRLHIQKRDNVDFYLCCKFQLSAFSVRRKTDVTDGVTDKRNTGTVCRGSAPRQNMTYYKSPCKLAVARRDSSLTNSSSMATRD